MDRDQVAKAVGVQPGEPLPAYAWPGGYPLYYVCKDGGDLCPDCANGRNGSMAADPDCQDDPQWQLVGYMVHYDGDPVVCDHCNAQVGSAYGPVDQV